MKLSQRLSTVASMVSKSYCVADVGTDHGYIPIHLVETGVVKRAIAMDINEGPLTIAKEHIHQAGLDDRIETRLSDGVAALHAGEAQTIVIAGMGGLLIKKILQEGLGTIYSAKELILSPQSDLEEFRKFLKSQTIAIAQEKLVFEDGKYYWIMKCIPHRGSVPSTVSERVSNRFGVSLFLEKDPILHRYLQEQEEKLSQILEQSGERVANPERMNAVRDELEAVKEGLRFFEGE